MVRPGVEGGTPQALSDEEIDAEVVKHRGGVDPMPWIRQLDIPTIWVYGALDKHIPTRLSVRNLTPLANDPNRDLSIAVFPRANHALIQTETGLTSEMLRSDTWASRALHACRGVVASPPPGLGLETS